MSFLLKPRIFQYFGVNSKVKDTFKDVNGKGINERYQECLGEGYDDELQDLLDNFIDRTIVPAEILSRLIPYMEYNLGNPVVVSNDVSMRRKMIQFAHRIYNIKSTKLSYEILLRMLGFDTVVIQEFTITSGFDSDLTFDDPSRTFDQGNRACNYYSVLLTGAISISPQINEAIFRILDYLEPINADLREVLYNGSPLVVVRIFDDTFDSTFE
jgi:hypothetical protein